MSSPSASTPNQPGSEVGHESTLNKHASLVEERVFSVMDRILPEKVHGVDLDEALTFVTPKVAKIQDRFLGCFYYLLVFGVIFNIFIYNMLFKNEHFEKLDVKGSSRLTIQQPTKGCNPNDNDCEDNWTPATQLPYCNQYEGEKMPGIKQGRCEYKDQHELLPEGMLTGEMFIPTRIDRQVEHKICNANASNGYYCKKLWHQDTPEVTYIANVEDFTLMVVTNYFRWGFSGTSTEHPGFYYECQDEKGKTLRTKGCEGKLTVKPIPCITKHCGFRYEKDWWTGRSVIPGTDVLLKRGDSRAFLSTDHSVKQLRHQESHRQSTLLATGDQLTREEEEDDSTKKLDVFAIPDGDIFRLGYLLELAGIDLDRLEEDQGNVNVHGEPVRERGAMIDIKVEYANLRPWWATWDWMTGRLRPGYKIKVVEREMDEMKTEAYSPVQPQNYPAKRIIENRHGIYVSVKIDGSFGQVSFAYFMLMLVTSMAMLNIAAAIVRAIALYWPGKFQEQYHDAIYGEVKDIQR